MANLSGALMKLGGSALQQGSKKAIEKVANKAIEEVANKAATKAITQSVTRGLTGAGMSSLAPKAGSTLDGILGKSSGIVLPSVKNTPKTLAERSGGAYSTIGDAMDDLGYSLADIKADKTLSKKNIALLDKNTREIAEVNRLPLESVGISSKTSLPVLNREQFYDDTLGKVGKNGVRAVDVPDYMQKRLSNPQNAEEAFSRGSNDEILRDLFQDQTSPISELYDKYDKLASSANANDIFTPENVNQAIELANYDKPGSGDAITQDFADRAFGNKRDIAVTGGSSPAKNVKVERVKAGSGMIDVPVDAENSGLANKLSEMREELSAVAGGSGSGNGGIITTSTASPDYGGLGKSGFSEKLEKEASRPINVQVRADGAAGSATKPQEGLRFVRDRAAKRLNPTPRQYADIMGKSRSIGNLYETVADRINAENIVQANVSQKTEAALNHIENIKAKAFEAADELGLKVDLSGIDNTIGLKPYQKRQLTEQGYNLNEIIGDKTLSATQAEDVYRILRGYAYDLMDDNSKPLEKAAGRSLNEAANEVSKRIDDVLDNMGLDFKKEFLDGAGVGGVDMNGKYLREISGNGKPLRFSDLRREESDWINISKTATRPLKEEKVPESITEAVGQAFKKGGEKAREKYYERQAYGAGGGSMGGGSVPPIGGDGFGGNINFESIGAGNSMLGGLLSKAKTAGLIGAGVLGGMALGGNGGSGNGADLAGMSYNPETETESEPEIDPYSSLNIGGYTYDQLESGYAAALMAGDTDAAKLIANMIGMLDDKISRYNEQKKATTESAGGIAGKQKAALNVLSGLMQNYQAQGPIGGRFTAFMNGITGGGYNPAVAAYESGAKGSLGTVIKALGDTGALSEGDQKRALELLPSTTDSPEAAKYKYQQLIQILKGAGAQ